MSKRNIGWYLGARAVALIPLSAFAMAAPPAGSSVSFAYPPGPTAGSLRVNTVDSVYAEWTSTFAEAYLYFYCNSGPNSDTETIFHQGVSQSGNAIVSLAGQGPLENRSDWSTPLRCWFDLNYADKGGQGIGALVVSVTSTAAEATTYIPAFAQASESPSPTPSPSTVSSVSSSATTTASQTEAASPFPTESNSNGASPSATRNRATAANAQPTTTSASTATNPPPLSSPAAASAGAKAGLSAGTAAGIAVGALAGVVAIAALAFFLYRRRKQNKQTPYVEQNYGNEAPIHRHLEKPHGVAVVRQHHEPAPMYAAPTYEMQDTQLQELSAMNSARESLKEKRY